MTYSEPVPSGLAPGRLLASARLDLPLAGIVLSMLVAATLSRPGPPTSVLANALFWVCLLRYLAVTERGFFAAPWFLVLVPLFYLTFAAARPAVQLPDYVFNSDTERYLREAVSLRVQTRHIGFPVVIFPMASIRGVFSRRFGWPEGGREYLFLQSAFAGALLVRLFQRSIARLPTQRAPGPPPSGSPLAERDRSGRGRYWQSCFYFVLGVHGLLKGHRKTL